MEKEFWVPVVGFEKYYSVSNFGKIKSFKRSSLGKIMKLTNHGSGYKRVYLRKNNKEFPLLVHRIVFQSFNGYLPKVIDHADRNPSNNCLLNLREATQSQNIYNSKTRSDNLAGATGVCYRKESGKWRSYYYLDGKQKYIGDFKTKEDALEARNREAKNFHGEFFLQRRFEERINLLF